MNAKQRQAYWLQWERNRLITEHKYKAKIRKVLLHKIEEVTAAIRLGGIEYGKRSMNFDILNTELVNIYTQIYKETSIRFANMVYRALKIESTKGANFGFNEEWAREAARFLSLKGIPLISLVTDNLRDIILKAIDDALQEGIMDSLALNDIIDLVLDRVTGLYENASRYWAERIARTETVRGANYGAMQGARKHGFLTTKEWIATHDKRTRDSHISLDGQVQDLDKPFHNYEDIMQPGDPEASAQNTINCRCAVGFTAKRDENGKIIRK